MDSSIPTPHQKAKQVVTLRLDAEAKAKLAKIAGQDGRTISELIDISVREFLDRHFLGEGMSRPHAKLRVRYARLPDTSVLKAFDELAPEVAKEARKKWNLPTFDFIGGETEWRRLGEYLNSNEAGLLESVNRSAIFSLRAASSPALDWVGPYFQLFVGHCVFVREDIARGYLPAEDLALYENFRLSAKTGKDLSLRTVVAWLNQCSLDDRKRLSEALERMWNEMAVACQLGTDYEIAVKRVGPILAEMRGQQYELVRYPIGDDNIGDFLSGAVQGFSGNLLHSATLLGNHRKTAYLLAGPADLRIPSVNVLAGQKGMFTKQVTAAGAAAPAAGELGDRVLRYWCEAVQWFRDKVVGVESDPALLRKYVKEQFPEFPVDSVGDTEDLAPLAILKNLMQFWVKWFADPNDAVAFLGPEGTERLVKHYQKLCDSVSASQHMTAPAQDSAEEQALWRFSTLKSTAASKSPQEPTTTATKGNTKKAGPRSVTTASRSSARKSS